MDFKDLLVLLGIITGLVGACSALLTGIIAFLAYRRDGAIVKIEARRGWELINARPPYSEDKKYTSVTVYNRGRRHANIAKVGEAYLIRSGGGIYSDSMLYGVRKLEEDTAADYLAEENPELKRPKVGYYYATSSSGKTYKLYPYTRFVHWLFYPARKISYLKSKKSSKS